MSAEAQVCARKAVEGVSSDDDVCDINVKRASNGEGTRKRRVVLDFSDDDEYEGAVSLASPDTVKGKSGWKLKESVDILVPEKSNLNFDKQVEDKPKVKEEMGMNKKSNQPLKEDSSVVSKDRIMGITPTEKNNNCIPESYINEKDKSTKAAPDSPKRRKLVRTHIDERGREGTAISTIKSVSHLSLSFFPFIYLFFTTVSEVIWECQETAAPKKADSVTMKTDSNTVTSAVNR